MICNSIVIISSNNVLRACQRLSYTKKNLFCGNRNSGQTGDRRYRVEDTTRIGETGKGAREEGAEARFDHLRGKYGYWERSASALATANKKLHRTFRCTVSFKELIRGSIR